MGRANGWAFAMYASMRGSFVAMHVLAERVRESYDRRDRLSTRQLRLRRSHTAPYGSRMRFPLVRAGLALLLVLFPWRAQAQRFIGSVLLPDGRTPAAGVIVVARDAAGRDVAQAVTGAEGRFVLFVDSATTLALQLQRVGFAPTVGPTRRLATDEIADVVITLSPEPVRVPALRRGATTCGRGGDDAQTALVLEEVRKAFVAAQAAIGRSDTDARFATFEHRTAKTGEDTLRSLYRRGFGALPALFRASTTEELERGGFFATLSGERIFRAPEPSILASPWFTSTHCFTLVPQGDSALRVTFRPTRERRGLVDVSGTYVLDPRTLVLRRVEFRYEGMPAEERKSDAGGLLEFTQLADGDWVVTRWWQRFPLLGYRTSDGATTLIRSSMTLVDITGHRVVGGRVVAVLSEGRTLLRLDPVEGPSATSPFGKACAERLGRQNTGAAQGVLAPVDSESVSAVLVKATWGEPVVVDRTVLTTREHIREAYTDANGAWMLCDLPARRDITLRWEARGQERTIPFTIPTAGTITTVSRSPAP